MNKILFVCLGNICRSPTADGIMQNLIKQHGLQKKLYSDSAGTAAYHVGELPDSRTRQHAANNGISLEHLRARQVNHNDFSEFNLILAMDNANYIELLQRCPPELSDKIKMLLDYHPSLKGQDVPDPYYGGSQGFKDVFDMCEAACKQLIKRYK